MTYNNDGYGIQNMDAVVAHEIGHIFYALDEYKSAGIPCSTPLGLPERRRTPTASTLRQEVCGLNVSSIMRGQISPFVAGAMAGSTRAELGWRDSTGTGILDPVNTAVTLAVNPAGSYTRAGGRHPALQRSGRRHSLALTHSKLRQHQHHHGCAIPDRLQWTRGATQHRTTAPGRDRRRPSASHQPDQPRPAHGHDPRYELGLHPEPRLQFGDSHQGRAGHSPEPPPTSSLCLDSANRAPGATP